MLTFAASVLAARKRGGRPRAVATFGKVQVDAQRRQRHPVAGHGLARRPRRRRGDAERARRADPAPHASRRRDGTDAHGRPRVGLARGRRSTDAPRPVGRRWPTVGDVPVLPTGAGHDAGILSARVPTAMLFVRNPTGVSHSPDEYAETADCRPGARALADVLEDRLA